MPVGAHARVRGQPSPRPNGGPHAADPPASFHASLAWALLTALLAAAALARPTHVLLALDASGSLY